MIIHPRPWPGSLPVVHWLGRFQTKQEQGPGLECYHTGAAVVVERFEEVGSRWPGFAEEATRRGFTSTVAVPMRLHADTIGVLNLLARGSSVPVGPLETRVSRAMADVATIAILQYRLIQTNQQLELALDSRVVVEQGKGVLITRLQVREDEAFELLRNRARATRRRLIEVADEVRRRGPDTDWNDYRQAHPPSHGQRQ